MRVVISIACAITSHRVTRRGSARLYVNAVCATFVKRVDPRRRPLCRRDLDKLDGRWRLVFTNNLVGLGKLSPIALKDVYQVKRGWEGKGPKAKLLRTRLRVAWKQPYLFVHIELVAAVILVCWVRVDTTILYINAELCLGQELAHRSGNCAMLDTM